MNTENNHHIAFSLDLLLPGVYLWTPWFSFCFGGEPPDDEPYRYPGENHSSWGAAAVLPGYRVLTTYQGTFDPR